MKSPPRTSDILRKSREGVFGRVWVMVFEGESATGVPRAQRPNFGCVYRYPSACAWARGRALRGFVATAACGLGALLGPRSARAEAVARFADLPSESPAAATSAPPTASPPPAPPPPSPVVSTASVPVGPPPPPPVNRPSPSLLPASTEAGFSRRLAQSHFERAELLESRGDIAQALHEYTETIGIDSTMGDAYLRLAALRERIGDAREADLLYSAAAELSDTRPRALLQRSRLRRSAGLSAQALKDLESAIELDPSRSALEELARGYVESHAWPAALAVFRRIAANAAESGDAAGLETAHLEVRALRVLAAETDPSQASPPKHDWIGRALRSIARR